MVRAHVGPQITPIFWGFSFVWGARLGGTSTNNLKVSTMDLFKWRILFLIIGGIGATGAGVISVMIQKNKETVTKPTPRDSETESASQDTVTTPKHKDNKTEPTPLAKDTTHKTEDNIEIKNSKFSEIDGENSAGIGYEGTEDSNVNVKADSISAKKISDGGQAISIKKKKELGNDPNMSKKGGIQVNFNGLNISNIRGSGAAAIEFSNFPEGSLNVNVNDADIREISKGGKGVFFSQSKEWKNELEIIEKFPTLSNINLRIHKYGSSGFSKMPTDRDELIETYSCHLYDDQNGDTFVQTIGLEVSSLNGERLITKSEFIGLDPIHINEEWINLYQPLEQAAPNFGVECHSEIQLPSETIQDSCVYFVLLEINEDYILFLTGRDKCMPWQDNYAPIPSYGEDGGLLQSYLKPVK